MATDPIAKALGEGQARIDRWSLWDRVMAEAGRQDDFAGLLTKFEKTRTIRAPWPGEWTIATNDVEQAAQELADAVLATIGLRTRLAGQIWCTLVRL